VGLINKIRSHVARYTGAHTNRVINALNKLAAPNDYNILINADMNDEAIVAFVAEYAKRRNQEEKREASE
jgi:hypothetical protein